MNFRPLHRKYFGEKVGIYFAWLGFYTTMLIPAALLGLVAFVYGIVSLFQDIPRWRTILLDLCSANSAFITAKIVCFFCSEDVCNEGLDLLMCPMCDKNCDFWNLDRSCLYSRITYVFDNYATVAFAAFMSIWGRWSYWNDPLYLYLPWLSVWVLQLLFSLNFGRDNRKPFSTTGMWLILNLRRQVVHFATHVPFWPFLHRSLHVFPLTVSESWLDSIHSRKWGQSLNSRSEQQKRIQSQRYDY